MQKYKYEAMFLKKGEKSRKTISRDIEFSSESDVINYAFNIADFARKSNFSIFKIMISCYSSDFCIQIVEGLKAWGSK